MQFNVSQLLKEHVGATRHYDLDPEPPVHHGRVDLLRTRDGVLVHVEAEVVLDADCARCLTPFGYLVEIAFDEVYYQQVDPATGARLAPPDEADPFLIDLRHTIDITEAVRQYSEMAAAMQPLCRPDCPGLCPVCGIDLSMESCNCERERLDPRWSALAELRTPGR